MKKQKRQNVMKKAVQAPKPIKSAKFGLRKTHFKSDESPTIGTYMHPNKGYWGYR